MRLRQQLQGPLIYFILIFSFSCCSSISRLPEYDLTSSDTEEQDSVISAQGVWEDLKDDNNGLIFSGDDAWAGDKERLAEESLKEVSHSVRDSRKKPYVPFNSLTFLQGTDDSPSWASSNENITQQQIAESKLAGNRPGNKLTSKKPITTTASVTFTTSQNTPLTGPPKSITVTDTRQSSSSSSLPLSNGSTESAVESYITKQPTSQNTKITTTLKVTRPDTELKTTPSDLIVNTTTNIETSEFSTEEPALSTWFPSSIIISPSKSPSSLTRFPPKPSVITNDSSTDPPATTWHPSTSEPLVTTRIISVTKLTSTPRPLQTYTLFPFSVTKPLVTVMKKPSPLTKIPLLFTETSPFSTPKPLLQTKKRHPTSKAPSTSEFPPTTNPTSTAQPPTYTWFLFTSQPPSVASRPTKAPTQPTQSSIFTWFPQFNKVPPTKTAPPNGKPLTKLQPTSLPHPTTKIPERTRPPLVTRPPSTRQPSPYTWNPLITRSPPTTPTPSTQQPPLSTRPSQSTPFPTTHQFRPTSRRPSTTKPTTTTRPSSTTTRPTLSTSPSTTTRYTPSTRFTSTHRPPTSTHPALFTWLPQTTRYFPVTPPKPYIQPIITTWRPLVSRPLPTTKPPHFSINPQIKKSPVNTAPSSTQLEPPSDKTPNHNLGSVSQPPGISVLNAMGILTKDLLSNHSQTLRPTVSTDSEKQVVRQTTERSPIIYITPQVPPISTSAVQVGTTTVVPPVPPSTTVSTYIPSFQALNRPSPGPFGVLPVQSATITTRKPDSRPLPTEASFLAPLKTFRPPPVNLRPFKSPTRPAFSQNQVNFNDNEGQIESIQSQLNHRNQHFDNVTVSVPGRNPVLGITKPAFHEVETKFGSVTKQTVPLNSNQNSIDKKTDLTFTSYPLSPNIDQLSVIVSGLLGSNLEGEVGQTNVNEKNTQFVKGSASFWVTNQATPGTRQPGISPQSSTHDNFDFTTTMAMQTTTSKPTLPAALVDSLIVTKSPTIFSQVNERTPSTTASLNQGHDDDADFEYDFYEDDLSEYYAAYGSFWEEHEEEITESQPQSHGIFPSRLPTLEVVTWPYTAAPTFRPPLHIQTSTFPIPGQDNDSILQSLSYTQIIEPQIFNHTHGNSQQEIFAQRPSHPFASYFSGVNNLNALSSVVRTSSPSSTSHSLAGSSFDKYEYDDYNISVNNFNRSVEADNEYSYYDYADHLFSSYYDSYYYFYHDKDQIPVSGFAQSHNSHPLELNSQSAGTTTTQFTSNDNRIQGINLVNSLNTIQDDPPANSFPKLDSQVSQVIPSDSSFHLGNVPHPADVHDVGFLETNYVAPVTPKTTTTRRPAVVYTSHVNSDSVLGRPGSYGHGGTMPQSYFNTFLALNPLRPHYSNYIGKNNARVEANLHLNESTKINKHHQIPSTNGIFRHKILEDDKQVETISVPVVQNPILGYYDQIPIYSSHSRIATTPQTSSLEHNDRRESDKSEQALSKDIVPPKSDAKLNNNNTIKIFQQTSGSNFNEVSNKLFVPGNNKNKYYNINASDIDPTISLSTLYQVDSSSLQTDKNIIRESDVLTTEHQLVSILRPYTTPARPTHTSNKTLHASTHMTTPTSPLADRDTEISPVRPVCSSPVSSKIMKPSNLLSSSMTFNQDSTVLPSQPSSPLITSQDNLRPLPSVSIDAKGTDASEQAVALRSASPPSAYIDLLPESTDTEPLNVPLHGSLSLTAADQTTETSAPLAGYLLPSFPVAEQNSILTSPSSGDVDHPVINSIQFADSGDTLLHHDHYHLPRISDDHPEYSHDHNASIMVKVWSMVGGQLQLMGEQSVPSSMFMDSPLTNGAVVNPQDVPAEVLAMVASGMGHHPYLDPMLYHPSRVRRSLSQGRGESLFSFSSKAKENKNDNKIPSENINTKKTEDKKLKKNVYLHHEPSGNKFTELNLTVGKDVRKKRYVLSLSDIPLPPFVSASINLFNNTTHNITESVIRRQKSARSENFPLQPIQYEISRHNTDAAPTPYNYNNWQQQTRNKTQRLLQPLTNKDRVEDISDPQESMRIIHLIVPQRPGFTLNGTKVTSYQTVVNGTPVTPSFIVHEAAPLGSLAHKPEIKYETPALKYPDNQPEFIPQIHSFESNIGSSTTSSQTHEPDAQTAITPQSTMLEHFSISNGTVMHQRYPNVRNKIIHQLNVHSNHSVPNAISNNFPVISHPNISGANKDYSIGHDGHPGIANHINGYSTPHPNIIDWIDRKPPQNIMEENSATVHNMNYRLSYYSQENNMKQMPTYAGHNGPWPTSAPSFGDYQNYYFPEDAVAEHIHYSTDKGTQKASQLTISDNPSLTTLPKVGQSFGGVGNNHLVITDTSVIHRNVSPVGDTKISNHDLNNPPSKQSFGGVGNPNHINLPLSIGTTLEENDLSHLQVLSDFVNRVENSQNYQPTLQGYLSSITGDPQLDQRQDFLSARRPAVPLYGSLGYLAPGTSGSNIIQALPKPNLPGQRGSILELLPDDLSDVNPLLKPDDQPVDHPLDLHHVLATLPSTNRLHREQLQNRIVNITGTKTFSGHLGNRGFINNNKHAVQNSVSGNYGGQIAFNQLTTRTNLPIINQIIPRSGMTSLYPLTSRSGIPNLENPAGSGNQEYYPYNVNTVRYPLVRPWNYQPSSLYQQSQSKYTNIPRQQLSSTVVNHLHLPLTYPSNIARLPSIHQANHPSQLPATQENYFRPSSAYYQNQRNPFASSQYNRPKVQPLHQLLLPRPPAISQSFMPGHPPVPLQPFNDPSRIHNHQFSSPMIYSSPLSQQSLGIRHPLKNSYDFIGSSNLPLQQPSTIEDFGAFDSSFTFLSVDQLDGLDQLNDDPIFGSFNGTLDPQSAILPVPATVSSTSVTNCLSDRFCALGIALFLALAISKIIALPFLVPMLVGRRRRKLEYLESLIKHSEKFIADEGQIEKLLENIIRSSNSTRKHSESVFATAFSFISDVSKMDPTADLSRGTDRDAVEEKIDNFKNILRTLDKKEVVSLIQRSLKIISKGQLTPEKNS